MIMAADESTAHEALREEIAEAAVDKKGNAVVSASTESSKGAGSGAGSGVAAAKDAVAPATKQGPRQGHRQQRGGRGGQPRRGVNAGNAFPMMPGAYPGWFPAPPPMMQQPMGMGGRPNGADAGSTKTNLYVSGLPPTATDDSLMAQFAKFGAIVSAKVMVEHASGACKGYGFVMFKDALAATRAVNAMRGQQVTCRFAKESYNDRVRVNQELDSTNLYMANLPPTWTESDLQAMLCQHGTVVSTRILRDQRGFSRGVGFARMETREQSEAIIKHFGRDWIMPGCVQPLQVRYADNTQQKKQRSERRYKMALNTPADGSMPMSVLPPGQAMMMAMPAMMPTGIPGSPTQAYMTMPSPSNWMGGQMYAMPYGMAAAAAGAGTGAEGVHADAAAMAGHSVSPTALQQVTSQLQNMSLNSSMLSGPPGQIAMVPMYATPQNFYGRYPMVPPQQQPQQE